MKATEHGSVNGLMRAKRKVLTKKMDGISARYQGNIHNCMDKVGRNANMGGTAGVTLLSLF
ncbi:MAG: hypothetical protein ACLSCV_09305 [Acutalibacteraceae bacterium]